MAPTDGFIQPPPNQVGGPMVDTSVVTTSSGSVNRERVNIADAQQNSYANVDPSGSVQVADAHQVRFQVAAMAQQEALARANPPAGFVPLEVPSFLGGF